MASDIGRRSAPCCPAAPGLAACTSEAGSMRTLCTASRTAHASRRCGLLSWERRLSKEGELTEGELGRVVLRVGELGGVLRDVRATAPVVLDLAGKAYRDTGSSPGIMMVPVRSVARSVVWPAWGLWAASRRQRGRAAGRRGRAWRQPTPRPRPR
eukprot:scaffold51789_cov54-Phaeocystis_antarctica.AAC.7